LVTDKFAVSPKLPFGGRPENSEVFPAESVTVDVMM
jgi:hypothetical protein